MAADTERTLTLGAYLSAPQALRDAVDGWLRAVGYLERGVTDVTLHDDGSATFVYLAERDGKHYVDPATQRPAQTSTTVSAAILPEPPPEALVAYLDAQ